MIPMSMRVAGVAGLVFCLWLLPLVCLCQFVPGQTRNGPYLLLFPRPHTAPAAETLTDDQLIEMALATGQSVSVTDEGDVTVGYGGEAPLPATTAAANLGRQTGALEQNPQLAATVPPAAPMPAPDRPRPASFHVPAPASQYDPAPPERPPRRLAVFPYAII
jgi:hypothetical protein